DQPTADSGGGVPDYQPPRAQQEPPVRGESFVPPAIAVEPTGAPFQPPAPIWPVSDAALLSLPTATASGSARVGGVAISLAGDDQAGADGPIAIESFSRAATIAAGVDGVLLRVSRPGGLVGAGVAQLTVDYGEFRWGYGGDWSSRLVLWVMPQCALS